MAFQDSAESLAEKLHLSRVPRPVFAAIALVLALVVALAVFAFATSPGSGIEVTAASDETAAQSAEDAGEEEARADGPAAAATPRRRRRPRTGRTWCSLREAMLRRGASASMWTAAWRRRASTIWRRAVAS